MPSTLKRQRHKPRAEDEDLQSYMMVAMLTLLSLHHDLACLAAVHGPIISLKLGTTAAVVASSVARRRRPATISCPDVRTLCHRRGDAARARQPGALLHLALAHKPALEAPPRLVHHPPLPCVREAKVRELIEFVRGGLTATDEELGGAPSEGVPR